MVLRENGPRPKHAVIVLVDAEGNVGHVGTRRLDQPASWLAVWQHRAELDSPLANWLRKLDQPPAERILIGSVGMHGRTARAVLALVAPWFGLANPASNVGGRGRPTGRIEPDGSLRWWPSRAAAAAELGVSLWVVRRRVRAGKMFDLG
jgi:hypothetical protein